VLRRLLLFAVIVAAGALVLYVLQRMTAVDVEPREPVVDTASSQPTDDDFKVDAEGLTITIWQPGSRTTYWCPDHPERENSLPGACPVCGRPLVLKPGEATAGRISRIIRAREYELDPENPKKYRLTDVTVENFAESGGKTTITADDGMVDTSTKDKPSGWLEGDVRLVAEDDEGTMKVFAERMEWGRSEVLIRAPGLVRMTRDDVLSVTGEDLDVRESGTGEHGDVMSVSLARSAVVTFSKALPGFISGEDGGEAKIECDGALVYRSPEGGRTDAPHRVVFNRNVIARQGSASLSAGDRLEVDLARAPDDVESETGLVLVRAYAVGTVRIQSTEMTGRGDTFLWTRAGNLAVLTGEPARAEETDIRIVAGEIRFRQRDGDTGTARMVVPGEGEMRFAGPVMSTGGGAVGSESETVVEWTRRMEYSLDEGEAEFEGDVRGESSDGNSFRADNVRVTLAEGEDGVRELSAVAMTGDVRIDQPDRGVRGNAFFFDKAKAIARIDGSEDKLAVVSLGDRASIEARTFRYNLANDAIVAEGNGRLNHTPREVPGAPGSAGGLGPVHASWTRRFEFDAARQVMTLEGDVVTEIKDSAASGSASGGSVLRSDKLVVELDGQEGPDEAMSLRKLTALGNVSYRDENLTRQAWGDMWVYDIGGAQRNLLQGSPAKVRVRGDTDVLMYAPEMSFSEDPTDFVASGPGHMSVAAARPPADGQGQPPLEIRWETGCRYDGDSLKAIFDGPGIRATWGDAVISCGHLEVGFVGEDMTRFETFLATESVVLSQARQKDKPGVTAVGERLEWNNTTGKITLAGPEAVVTIGDSRCAARELVLALDESGGIDLSGVDSVKGAHVIKIGSAFGP